MTIWGMPGIGRAVMFRIPHPSVVEEAVRHGDRLCDHAWAYYCYYGDTVLLNRHYEGMKQWVAYLGTRTDARGIIVREEPDGWCLGDWCAPGKKMELPEPLVNTAYYYHSADLMSKGCGCLRERGRQTAL